MSRLFDRRWKVTVDTIETTALDVTFRVEKHLKPEPNTCELTLYNLTREHQAQLEELGSISSGKGKASKKSRALGGTSATKAVTGIPCKIEAGYADAGPQLIWLGDLRTVETVKDGSDWVTTLTSGDGEKGWQNARLHIPYGPKTPVATALRAIVRALGVDEGNLSKVVARIKMAGSDVYPAGKVISGAAQRAVLDFARSANLEISIQDSAIQILDRGKALDGEAILLNSETGLIGSPTVDNTGILTAQMLMIPGVQPGRLITLDAERIKGTYKIAEAVCTGDTHGDDWGWEVKGPRY